MKVIKGGSPRYRVRLTYVDINRSNNQNESVISRTAEEISTPKNQSE